MGISIAVKWLAAPGATALVAGRPTTTVQPNRLAVRSRLLWHRELAKPTCWWEEAAARSRRSEMFALPSTSHVPGLPHSIPGPRKQNSRQRQRPIRMTEQPGVAAIRVEHRDRH
jgi:hypothetical protein